MTTTTLTDISPHWVGLNRRLWGAMFLGQAALAAGVLVAIAADLAPPRVRVTPQIVGLDVMVLAMGVALLVLHRRHPELTGDPAHDRTRYGRNILFPVGMLAAATVFGLAIVFLTQCVWPAALVPVVAMAVQLAAWPARHVG